MIIAWNAILHLFHPPFGSCSFTFFISTFPLLLLFLSLPLSICLSVSYVLNISLTLSFSKSLSLSVYFVIPLFVSCSVCLYVCLSFGLPVCSLVCLLAYLSVCLFVCLPSFVFHIVFHTNDLFSPLIQTPRPLCGVLGRSRLRAQQQRERWWLISRDLNISENHTHAGEMSTI